MKSVSAAKLLADYISQHKYGDIIQSQEIERVTGYKYGSSQYYQTVARAKRVLEAGGKAIVSVGKGYRIVYPGDYTELYAREIRRAQRRVRHGRAILDGAPTRDMTQSEIQEYNGVRDFAVRLEAQFCGSAAEVRRLTAGRKNPMQIALGGFDGNGT